MVSTETLEPCFPLQTCLTSVRRQLFYIVSVAATGVPTAQSDHMILMARFLCDCMRKIPKYLKKMEVSITRDRHIVDDERSFIDLSLNKASFFSIVFSRFMVPTQQICRSGLLCIAGLSQVDS